MRDLRVGFLTVSRYRCGFNGYMFKLGYTYNGEELVINQKGLANIQLFKVTMYIYLSIALRYNLEVLTLYF